MRGTIPFKAIALLAVLSFAAAAGAAPSSLKNYKGTVKLSGGTFVSGPCTTSSFTDRCTNDNCECATFSGTYSGTAGKGTVNYNVTINYGDGEATIGSGADANQGCSPIFGQLVITASKDTETFDVMGGGCGLVNGQGINQDATAIGGGCILIASTLFSNGAVLSCTGMSSGHATSGRIKLKGPALE